MSDGPVQQTTRSDPAPAAPVMPEVFVSSAVEPLVPILNENVYPDEKSISEPSSSSSHSFNAGRSAVL